MADLPHDEHDTVERRLSDARTRMLDRLQEVGRRVEHAKDALDVAQMIRAHPLLAVGVGVAAGSLVALPHGSVLSTRARALIGGLALRLLQRRLDTWLTT